MLRTKEYKVWRTTARTGNEDVARDVPVASAGLTLSITIPIVSENLTGLWGVLAIYFKSCKHDAVWNAVIKWI